MQQRPQSAVNPLPPIVTALFLVVVGIEAILWLGSKGVVGGTDGLGWRFDALQRFALLPEAYDWMLQTGSIDPDAIRRLFTYPFIHLRPTNVIFAGVLLLALGKFVGEILHPLAVLAVFMLSGAVGGAVYGLLTGDGLLLYGAFPNVYGLIGAYTYLLWAHLSYIGAQRSQAFSLIAMLMGVRLLLGALFVLHDTWIADLAGFGAGYILTVFLAPGGWERLLARLRRR